MEISKFSKISVLVTLKNDSLSQYVAAPADCFKLHSPLSPLVENHGRTTVACILLFFAVLKCVRNPMHSPHKIARCYQSNEADTVAKQSNLLTFS